MAKLPVLFLTFNKTASTRQVMETIAAYAPERLYVAQDGARRDRPGEAERVAEVRATVQNVSWPCQTQYRLQEQNQGLKRHIEGAISWFFEHEPEGIILEDDTIPSADFFPFVEELIERFRDDNRVMMVGGCNLNMISESPYSYFFTNYPLIWGWATWRNRWQLYDEQIRAFEEMLSDKSAQLVYPDPFRRETEQHRVAELKAGRTQSWGFRWGYTMLTQHGLCAAPVRNTVVNVGFGQGATNTLDPEHPSAHLHYQPVEFPLKHPPYMALSAEWENRFFYPGQQMHRFFALKELGVWLVRRLRDKLLGRK